MEHRYPPESDLPPGAAAVQPSSGTTHDSRLLVAAGTARPERTGNALPAARKETGRIDSSQRQEQLLDAFVAHCGRALRQEAGAKTREQLQTQLHWRASVWGEVSLGFYSGAATVMRELRAQGFTRDEISLSTVCGDPRLDGRLIVPWRDGAGVLRTIVAIDPGRAPRDRERSLYLRGRGRPPFFGMDRALAGPSPRKHLLLLGDLLEGVYLQAIGITNVLCTDNVPLSPAHLELLADRSVASLTIVARDADAASREAAACITPLHRAARSPALFAVDVEGDSDAGSLAAFVERRGPNAAADLLQRKLHVYAFAARDLLRLKPRDRDCSDHWVLDALRQAARFDATALQPERDAELNQVFWPEILRGICADWESLHQRLGGDLEPILNDLRRHRRRRQHAQLARDLQEAIRAGDVERFEAMLIDASRSLGVAEGRWDSGEALLSFAGPGYVPVNAPSPTPPGGGSRDFATQWEDHFQAAAQSAAGPPAGHPRSLANGPLSAREPTASEVSRLAYQLWEESGRPQGWDQHFWHTAENYLRNGRRGG